MARRKPYTETGISRVPCFRCGEPSTQQWQICSLNNQYKGFCTACDVELNEMVLKFVGICSKDVSTLIEDYRITSEEAIN